MIRVCWRLLLLLLAASVPTAAEIVSEPFGNLPDGRLVKRFTLKNRHGMTVKFAEYGATLTELHVPDAQGRLTNVTLGFDRLEPYLGRHPAFGATIGRYANRIANARFKLDGREISVTKNSGPNHIHGGRQHFGKVLWRGRVDHRDRERKSVVFTHVAADGEEGFPGRLTVTLTVQLADANELVLTYAARTSRTTVVNLTNHAYFNLRGVGDVLNHELRLHADTYTVPGDRLIPTGEIAKVAGTPLDFRTTHRIGERIAELYTDGPGGYDHNYVVRGRVGELRPAAEVFDPESGRRLEVLTTEPGVQLYTLNGKKTKLTGVGGVVYERHAGIALETQHFPDSPNHPHFPSTVLRPGERFHSQTVFRFSNRSE